MRMMLLQRRGPGDGCLVICCSFPVGSLVGGCSKGFLPGRALKAHLGHHSRLMLPHTVATRSVLPPHLTLPPSLRFTASLRAKMTAISKKTRMETKSINSTLCCQFERF